MSKCGGPGLLGRVFLALLAAFAAPAARGQDAAPERLGDLRSTPVARGSDPLAVMVSPTHVFAVAHVGRQGHGYALVAADRTSGAVTLATTLDGGPYVNAPELIAVVNGNLVLQAHDVDLRTGRETAALWTSDGTPGGTVRRAPTRDEYGDPLHFDESLVVGNRLFMVFERGDLLYDPRLMVSDDGGASFTVLVQSRVTLAGLTEFDGIVYFTAGDAEHGRELWRSDGTVGGTRLFADLRPGPDSADPHSLTATPSGLWFNATDDAHGAEPWITDGTPEGTRLVADVAPGPDSSGAYRFTETQGFVHFTAAGPGSTVPFATSDDYGLWRSDGTAEGTERIGTYQDANVLGVAGGRVVFRAHLPGMGDQLWATSDVAGDAVLLADIRPTSGWLSLGTLGAARDRVVFVADDGVTGEEPWSTDGTPEGTVQLADLNPGEGTSYPALTATDGNEIWFVATDPIVGREVFVTDGTPAGTRLAANFRSDAGDSSPSTWTVLPHAAGARLVFAADGDGVGREPWISDGTAAGTRLLLDVNPGEASSDPELLGSLGARLVFAADDGVHGREPWITDGTPEGTLLLADVQPGAPGSGPVLDSGFPRRTASRRVVAERVVFFADDGVHGREPWATDGSPGGTLLLRDVSPGGVSGAETTIADSYYEAPGVVSCRLGGSVWFRGADGWLWRTDGTPEGTVPALPSDSGAAVSPIRAGAGRVAFLTSTPLPRDRERLHLVTLDAARGTTTSTAIRSKGADIGAAATVPLGRRWVVQAGSRGTLQAALLGAGRRDLVVLSSDLRIGLSFDEMAVTGDRVFLGALGEPWTTDGTRRGTRPVPGSGGSYSEGLLALGNSGRVAFVANDPERGDAAWVTDGTADGTFLLADVRPGVEQAYPAEFALVGSRMVFAADDGATGRELWSVPAATAVPSCVIDTDGDGVPDVVESASPTGDPAVPDSGLRSSTDDVVVTHLSARLDFRAGRSDRLRIEGWWDAPSDSPLGASEELRAFVGGAGVARAVSGTGDRLRSAPGADGQSVATSSLLGPARVHRIRFRTTLRADFSAQLAELRIDGARNVRGQERVVPIYVQVGGHSATTSRTLRFAAHGARGALRL